VSLKHLAFHCERRGLLRLEGVSDPMAIGVVGSLTRHFCKVYMGCNMFKSMVLNSVLGAVQRLENAAKKRSAEWLLRN